MAIDVANCSGSTTRASPANGLGLVLERLVGFGHHAGGELNGLLSRDFPFATDPEDGIEGVWLRKMRLSIGNAKRRIILEADPQAGPQDIFDMMADCLSPAFLSNTLVNVTQAEFQFRFASKGAESQKPMTFSVSFPN